MFEKMSAFTQVSWAADYEPSSCLKEGTQLQQVLPARRLPRLAWLACSHWALQHLPVHITCALCESVLLCQGRAIRLMLQAKASRGTQKKHAARHKRLEQMAADIVTLSHNDQRLLQNLQHSAQQAFEGNALQQRSPDGCTADQLPASAKERERTSTAMCDGLGTEHAAQASGAHEASAAAATGAAERAEAPVSLNAGTGAEHVGAGCAQAAERRAGNYADAATLVLSSTDKRRRRAAAKQKRKRERMTECNASDSLRQERQAREPCAQAGHMAPQRPSKADKKAMKQPEASVQHNHGQHDRAHKHAGHAAGAAAEQRAADGCHQKSDRPNGLDGKRAPQRISSPVGPSDAATESTGQHAQIQSEILHAQPRPSGAQPQAPAKKGANKLNAMQQKLAGGRFRMLNERLYTISGNEALAEMQVGFVYEHSCCQSRLCTPLCMRLCHGVSTPCVYCALVHAA